MLLMISKALPQTCTAVRSIGTLSMLLGAPPPVQQHQDSDSFRSQEQQPQQQQEQPGNELPALCGEPKNKLSLHRRSNRRVSYYARRKELFAHCKFCGQTGMPHEFMAGSAACSGQCVRPPSKAYPKEYRPPV